MRLETEQLELALSVSDEHPVMAAFLQIIGDKVEDEMLSAILANLTAEDRAYNCGRAAALQELKLFIGSLRNDK